MCGDRMVGKVIFVAIYAVIRGFRAHTIVR